MNTSYEDEESPLISRPSTPTVVQDNQQSRKKQLAAYFILASTLFERVAFYTLAANLSLHFSSEKVSEESSSGYAISFSFSIISYLSTIVFAVISDWKLGREKTIAVGFFIYSIGYVLSIVVTTPNVYNCMEYLFNNISNSSEDQKHYRWCNVGMIATFIITAIGAGAVQSNMAVFGVEQIQESRITSRYFDKYVIVMNLSSIVAIWGIRLIFDSIAYTNKLINYAVISALATSMLFIGILIFIMGRRYYIHVKPYDSVITKCIPVIINAYQTQRQYKQQDHLRDNARLNSQSASSISASNNVNENQEEEPIATNQQPHSYLDFARVSNHGRFNDRIVDDVKSLRKAFFVFIILIPFWLIYTQLSSTFAMQGNYMKYGHLRVAYIWLGDPITVIIGLLILNKFLYKYLDDRNLSLTIVNKFVIGMCFAVITMVIAGTVEKFRQDGCDEIPNIDNTSTLHILWQLPQNIFMGFSEIFFMVASFEYAYFSAPRSAQTLFMSLRFCSIGVAALIGVAYMAILAKPNLVLDFGCDRNRKEKFYFYSYFYTFAGIQLIFIIIFILCQKRFHMIKMNPQRLEENQVILQTSWGTK